MKTHLVSYPLANACAWLALGVASLNAGERSVLRDKAADVAPAARASLAHLGPLDEFEDEGDAESAIEDGDEFLETAERTVQYAEELPGPWQAGAVAHPSPAGPCYDWHFMPVGLIYRSYLAGAKESRFRSVWHDEKDDGNIWDITLGGSVGLVRYGTRGDGRPEGWQLGIEGAGLVRLDTDVDRDVLATDYRFGVPLTWGDSISQVKFAYYHLSSHVGDEYLLRTPGFQRLNYSRDAFVLGHSIYPADAWRVYAEVEYAFYVDVSDPWAVQFGVDYAPSGRTGARGAPFAAVNAHLREEVNYGGNLVAQAGWAWRRSPATGLYRVGVEYYNGKDDQFSFFNDSVEKIGVGMWYDY